MISHTKRIKTTLQVRFNDLDMAGHVHNSIYLNYFEIGRIDFFNQTVDNEWNWKEKGILVARNEIDYIRPVQFYDNLSIETFCDEIGKKSITLAYEIFSDEKEERKLCAKGKSVLVCFDFKSNSSVEIFESWRILLKQ